MEKSVDSDHQSVAEKLTLVDTKAEPNNVGDVDSMVDAAVDENNQEEIQNELEDGEIVEPKEKTAAQKLQYSYEPGIQFF